MVSTAAQGGGTPSYYLDSVSGGACRILYFYLGGLKEGMKKRILATIMTLTLGAAMLTACGSKENDTIDNEPQTTVEAPTDSVSTEEASNDEIFF